MEDRMKKFLSKRLCESVLTKEEEGLPLMGAVMDYGVENIARENPLLVAIFLPKLCAINRDDMGLILSDLTATPSEKRPTGMIYENGKDLLQKMFDISGEVMGFYGKEIIPKDFKTKINFRGMGGTDIWGNSPEKSDLVQYNEGFSGHVSVEDGNVSIGLGQMDGADYEVFGPSTWVMRFLFGAVDPSDVEEGDGDYVGYMKEVFSNITNMILEKYPQYVFLKDEWFSRVNEEWNSDEEKMNGLKETNGTISIYVEDLDVSNIYPKDTMNAVLSSLDPAVKKGIDEEHKVAMLLQWKDGKVDLRILKPGEEPSSDGKFITNYETIMRIANGEDAVYWAHRRRDLMIDSKGKSKVESILRVLDGLVGFIHHMIDGSLIMTVRGTKGRC